uniref:Uncharacterized protein n=1 Tax=viral metagenome TaxID=1070528 RepID=A0A6M3L064_9ZZZZ
MAVCPLCKGTGVVPDQGVNMRPGLGAVPSGRPMGSLGAIPSQGRGGSFDPIVGRGGSFNMPGMGTNIAAGSPANMNPQLMASLLQRISPNR